MVQTPFVIHICELFLSNFAYVFYSVEYEEYFLFHKRKPHHLGIHFINSICVLIGQLYDLLSYIRNLHFLNLYFQNTSFHSFRKHLHLKILGMYPHNFYCIKESVLFLIRNWIFMDIQRVPALHAFWDLEKTVLYETCVSGTVLWSPTNANSPTYTYISQKTC